MNRTFKEELLEINQDLENVKKDKIELFTDCVNERLDGALEIYMQNLDDACSYILSEDCLHIMKSLSYKVVEKGK